MGPVGEHLPDVDALLSHWIRLVGTGIEAFRVFVIVAGIVWSSFLFVRRHMAERHYDTYKIRIGRSLLLGLEVLVAADIVKTIAIDLTFTSLALLAGLVLSASLRSLIPAAVLLTVGFALGVHWPGFGGLVIALCLVMGMGTIAACWGATIALRFRSQSGAPLMQAGMLLLILTTTSYAPLDLLTGWLQAVARYNPVTQIVEAVRQGFVGGVTWGDTWPGLVALAGLLALMSALALRGMRRTAV